MPASVSVVATPGTTSYQGTPDALDRLLVQVPGDITNPHMTVIDADTVQLWGTVNGADQALAEISRQSASDFTLSFLIPGVPYGTMTLHDIEAVWFGGNPSAADTTGNTVQLVPVDLDGVQILGTGFADTISVQDMRPTADATSFALVIGDKGRDTIGGHAGPDWIIGGGGSDVVSGGATAGDRADQNDVAAYDFGANFDTSGLRIEARSIDGVRKVYVTSTATGDLLEITRDASGTVHVTDLVNTNSDGTHPTDLLHDIETLHVNGVPGFSVPIGIRAYETPGNDKFAREIDGTVFPDTIDVATTLGLAPGATVEGMTLVYGANGKDVVTGTAGSEAFVGGGSDDTFDGGAGADHAAFFLNRTVGPLTSSILANGDVGIFETRDGTTTQLFNVHKDATTGAVTVAGLGDALTQLGTDTLTNVEGLHFGGSDALSGGQTLDLGLAVVKDRFTYTDYGQTLQGLYVQGTADGDTIDLTQDVYDRSDVYGNQGDDTIRGGASADWIVGGAGNDAIDGGAGTDHARYVIPDLTSVGWGTDENGNVTIWGSVNVDGTQQYADLFRVTFGDTPGTATVTSLWDTSLGVDTLTDVETIDVDTGLNNQIGTQISLGAEVREWWNTWDDNGVQRTSHDVQGSRFADAIDLSQDGSDSISVWAGAGDDVVTLPTSDSSFFRRADGGAGNDTLIGGEGLDMLYGEAGNDRLVGNGGSDEIEGGTGDDTIDGGEGFDGVHFQAPKGAVFEGEFWPSSYTVVYEGDRATVRMIDGDTTRDVLVIDRTGPGTFETTGLGILADAGHDTLTGIERIAGSAGIYFSVDLTTWGDAPANQAPTGIDASGVVAAMDEIRGPGAILPTDVEIADLSAIDDGVGTNLWSLGGADASAFRIDSDGRLWLKAGTALDFETNPEGFAVTAYVSDPTTGMPPVARDFSVALNDLAEHVVMGTARSETIVGSAGDDVIWGLAGTDRLDGGGGSDTLIGGSGSDTYVVDDASDVAVETDASGNDTGGTDTVLSSAWNYRLGAFIEKLTLTGSAAISGTGNDLANLITGNDGANTIDGAGGADSLWGGAGNDTVFGGEGGDRLEGEAGDDTLDGGEGNDRLSGGEGRDLLFGGDGSDRLDGGMGADLMAGGAGNDTYVVDQWTDRVDEANDDGSDAGGIDTVISSVGFTLGAYVEKLVLTGKMDAAGIGNELDNTIVGNDGANTLDGGAGNDVIAGGYGADVLLGGVGDDVLDGGAGVDLMIGGTGNDTYVVDDAGDMVFEFGTPDGGIDTIKSSISWTLGANVERLALIGGDAVDGTGNELANTLTGNDAANILDGGIGNDRLLGGAGDDILLGGSGNDTIDGGTGADTMDGGIGNDVYVVDDAGDLVIEAADGGTDAVKATVSYTLAANVENLRLAGTDAIAGYGNDLSNSMVGNDADNFLFGGLGADRIDGGLGNDTIVGGANADVLKGGEGSDTFLFSAGFGRDIVADFSVTDDTIAFDIATLDSFDQLSMKESGGNVVIAVTKTDSITIAGTTIDELSEHRDHFVFHADFV